MRFSLNIDKRYGLDITFLFYKYHLNIHLYQDIDKLKATLGIRNTVIGTPYKVTFLDYDSVMYDNLVGELKYLQHKYKLSDFYILASSQKSGSYHAINLDYLKPREWKNLLLDTNVDENYAITPINSDYRDWVLRIIPKGNSLAPKLITIVPSLYNKRKKSRAHALFLSKHHGININRLENLDNNAKLSYIKYDTMSYITKKEGA